MSVFVLSCFVVCVCVLVHVHGGGMGGTDLVMLSSVSVHWMRASLFFKCVCLFELVGRCLSKEILQQLYRHIPEGGVYKLYRLMTPTYIAENARHLWTETVYISCLSQMIIFFLWVNLIEEHFSYIYNWLTNKYFCFPYGWNFYQIRGPQNPACSLTLHVILLLRLILVALHRNYSKGNDCPGWGQVMPFAVFGLLEEYFQAATYLLWW